MYLKSLHLSGFKTFADPTTLEFGPGITGIVGPNGSGKSNLSDALLWVLGEQSMKSIRSPQLVDVIFNGAEGRRPLGMAEVTLVLDNSDSSLPLDFTEVAITRRTFRSGESEYAINKSPCRLRDIQELFLDTGLGRQNYAIITQNEVDRILSLRAEERRAVFEEAAGTARYRTRRTEALRKLEAAQLNLTRVNDILREVESQLEPLREQAEVARQYRDLSVRLRDLTLAFLVSENTRRTEAVEQLDREIESLRAELDALSKTSESAQVEEEAARGRLMRVEEELEVERRRFAELRSQVLQAEAETSLARERHQLMSDRISGLSGEVEDLRERLRAGRSAHAAASEARRILAATLERLGAELEESEAEASAASARLEAATAASGERRTQALSLAREQAAVEQRRRAAEEAHSEIRTRVQALTEALGSRQEEREALAAAEAALRDSLQGAQEEVEEASRESVRAQRSYEALQAEAEQVQGRQADLSPEIARLEARLQFLNQMDEGGGLARGAKFLLEKRRAGEMPGICGCVADILGVSAEYEAAVHMALGPRLHYVVVETEAQARQALDAIKEHGNCQMVLLPLDLIRAVPPSPSLEATASMQGIRGLASSLVVYHQRYAALVQHLLGRVLVAEDRAAAFSALQAAQHQGAVVTLDGDLFLPTGEMGGGAIEDDNPLRRRREMEEIERQLHQLASERDRGAQRWDHLKTEMPRTSLVAREWDAAYREKLQKVHEVELDLATKVARREALDAQIHALGQQAKEAAARAESLGRALDEAAARAKALALSPSPEQGDGLEDVQGLSLEVQRLTAALSELRSERAAQRERLTALDGRREAWEGEEPRLAAREEAAAAELERLKQEASRLRRDGSSLEANLAVSRQGLEESEAHLAELQVARDGAVAELGEAHAIHLEARNAVPEIQEKLGTAEIKRAQSQVQLQHIEERLAEEYNLTLKEAAEQVRLRAAAETAEAPEMGTIRRLQAQLRSMGEVNIGAISEYDRLAQRRDFLSEQRADLEGARAKLLELIAEIDEATTAQFLKTFEAVAEHFQTIFSRLFDSGSARLYLSDPERVLESGVEIEVELPGRAPLNLLALSGGERTLTAIALLFALLRTKPTPFCLLDEIDAALDESNVYRFIELLQDFRQEVQFLIITHARPSMEACDRLYGITMQDQGVSRSLSLELAEAVAVVDESDSRTRSRDFLRQGLGIRNSVRGIRE